jgi:hypothetical protein
MIEIVVEIRRRNSGLAILAALSDKLIDDRLRRSAGEEISTLRLINTPLDFLEINLRPPPRKLSYIKLFERNSGFFQKAKRAALIPIVSFGHPKHSDREKELPLPLRFVLLP